MTWTYEDQTVRIAKLPVSPLDNNVYVVACAQTHKAVVIDAANEGKRILDLCSGLDVGAVLTTHGHHDHIAALDEVKDTLSVPWMMHLADVEIAGRTPDEAIDDGDTFEVGKIMLHAIHTPGHTPGSVSFALEPAVFTGDTLFPGGPGSTQWNYSSFGEIMDSIEQRLFDFDDSTIVHPGHGASTSIGDERPSAPAWRARGW